MTDIETARAKIEQEREARHFVSRQANHILCDMNAIIQQIQTLENPHEAANVILMLERTIRFAQDYILKCR